MENTIEETTPETCSNFDHTTYDQKYITLDATHVIGRVINFDPNASLCPVKPKCYFDSQ